METTFRCVTLHRMLGRLLYQALGMAYVSRAGYWTRIYCQSWRNISSGWGNCQRASILHWRRTCVWLKRLTIQRHPVKMSHTCMRVSWCWVKRETRDWLAIFSRVGLSTGTFDVEFLGLSFGFSSTLFDHRIHRPSHYSSSTPNFMLSLLPAWSSRSRAVTSLLGKIFSDGSSEDVTCGFLYESIRAVLLEKHFLSRFPAFFRAFFFLHFHTFSNLFCQNIEMRSVPNSLPSVKFPNFGNISCFKKKKKRK